MSRIGYKVMPPNQPQVEPERKPLGGKAAALDPS
jgi:hypothetical protein